MNLSPPKPTTLAGLFKKKIGGVVSKIGEGLAELGRKIRYRSISREDAVKWIKSDSRDRVFAVDFIKRTTGGKRHMVCRYGVRIGLKGVGLAFDPDAYQLIVVWDVEIRKYRMINIPGMRGILITRKSSDGSVGEYFRVV